MNRMPSQDETNKKLVNVEGGTGLRHAMEVALGKLRDGVTIADAPKPDCPLIFINDGFQHLTGYSREEVLGKNCRFLQGPDTNPAVVKKLRASVRDGEPCVVQLLNYRKDGKPFWNRLSISPVKGPDGQVLRYIGIQSEVAGTRISELKEAQDVAMKTTIRSMSNLVLNFLCHFKVATMLLERAGTEAKMLESLHAELESFLEKLNVYSETQHYREVELADGVLGIALDE